MVNSWLCSHVLGYFYRWVGLQWLELLLAVLHCCRIGTCRADRLGLLILSRNWIAIVALPLMLTNVDSAVIQLLIMTFTWQALSACSAFRLLSWVLGRLGGLSLRHYARSWALFSAMRNSFELTVDAFHTATVIAAGMMRRNRLSLWKFLYMVLRLITRDPIIWVALNFLIQIRYSLGAIEYWLAHSTICVRIHWDL